MINKFQAFIQKHQLFNQGTPVLVACSGGLDSMVLLDVLCALKYPVAIAHCNFQLRGIESEGDEEFIRVYASQKNIPFYATRFDTTQIKQELNLSTQMAARVLRYDWFEKVRKEIGAHVIVTAHHLDDQLETVLLNLTRGTGLKGLSAMQPTNGNITRPLLEFTKEDLMRYAQSNNIEFREDSSNATDDYQRNLIRHQVVTALKQINPSLQNTFGDFVGYMRDYNELLKSYIELLKKKCYSEKKGIVEIKFGFIKSHNAGRTILFHLLDDFGFNNTQSDLIFDTFIQAKESGQQFYSASHRLVIDRKSLFIIQKDIKRNDYLSIEKISNQITFNNYKIQCSIVPIHELNAKTSPRYAYLDMDLLEFPLMLRYYKEGDYFYPFGMSKPKTPDKVGKKKISKFFKDEKFHQFDKENTAMLFSGERLVWLVGYRIDDRLKVSSKTKRVLKMVLLDEESAS